MPPAPRTKYLKKGPTMHDFMDGSDFIAPDVQIRDEATGVIHRGHLNAFSLPRGVEVVWSGAGHQGSEVPPPAGPPQRPRTVAEEIAAAQDAASVSSWITQTPVITLMPRHPPGPPPGWTAPYPGWVATEPAGDVDMSPAVAASAVQGRFPVMRGSVTASWGPIHGEH